MTDFEKNLDNVTKELEELDKTYSATKGSKGYENVWVPHDEVRLWSIPRKTGQLLRLFVLARRPQTILELGTSAGYSTIWLAAGARECGGKIYTVEMAQPKIEMATKNFERAGVKDQVEQIKGDIKEVLKKWDKPLDLVFLDADKMKYLSYVQQFERHLNRGAIIIADNATNFGNLMKDYLEYVTQNENYISHLVELDNGLMISVRR